MKTEITWHGLSDGIITALILASAGIIGKSTIDLFEAFKISFGSAFAGGFQLLHSSVRRTERRTAQDSIAIEP